MQKRALEPNTKPKLAEPRPSLRSGSSVWTDESRARFQREQDEKKEARRRAKQAPESEEEDFHDAVENNNMAFEDEDIAEAGTKPKLDIKLEFDKREVPLWLATLEDLMQCKDISAQKSKKVVLVSNLPPEVRLTCKQLLLKPDPGPTPYKDLKTLILKVYGPKETEALDKAEALRLTDLPSQLGQELIQTVHFCENEDCKVATSFIKALWLRQLPRSTAEALANDKLDPKNPQDLFDKADKVFQQHAKKTANQQVTEVTENVSAVNKSGKPKGKTKTKEAGARDKLSNGLCYIHATYGKEARKCLLPDKCLQADQVAPPKTKSY